MAYCHESHDVRSVDSILRLDVLHALIAPSDFGPAGNRCNVVLTSHGIAARGETPVLPVYGVNNNA
jgi:hypothetical protein